MNDIENAASSDAAFFYLKASAGATVGASRRTDVGTCSTATAPALCLDLTCRCDPVDKTVHIRCQIHASRLYVFLCVSLLNDRLQS